MKTPPLISAPVKTPAPTAPIPTVPFLFVLATLLCAALIGGCATGPCLPPEQAFGRYVAEDTGDPSARVVGRCNRYTFSDTGDTIVMCRVMTDRHGLLHKRLPERACFRE